MGVSDDDPEVIRDLRKLQQREPDDAEGSPAPGWYPNPSAAGQRYWDGSTWTGRYADGKGNVLDVPPPVRDDLAGRSPAALWVALAGGVAIVVGSLAPWANTLGEMASGIEWGWDGVVTVILGALALLLVWWVWANKSGKAAIACGVIAVVVLAVGAVDWININDTSELADELSEDQSDVIAALEIRAHESSLRSVAWGLYVMQFGAVALAVASLPLRRAVLKRHK